MDGRVPEVQQDVQVGSGSSDAPRRRYFRLLALALIAGVAVAALSFPAALYVMLGVIQPPGVSVLLTPGASESEVEVLSHALEADSRVRSVELESSRQNLDVVDAMLDAEGIAAPSGLAHAIPATLRVRTRNDIDARALMADLSGQRIDGSDALVDDVVLLGPKVIISSWWDDRWGHLPNKGIEQNARM